MCVRKILRLSFTFGALQTTLSCAVCQSTYERMIFLLSLLLFSPRSFFPDASLPKQTQFALSLPLVEGHVYNFYRIICKKCDIVKTFCEQVTKVICDLTIPSWDLNLATKFVSPVCGQRIIKFSDVSNFYRNLHFLQALMRVEC